MTLIDIGANLTHESFQHDLPGVLERARAAGVERILVTGASRSGSVEAQQLAVEHPGFLYATAGLHPHHAHEYDAELDALLRSLLAHPEVVAVGETGLDYHRDFSPRDAQRFAFEQQLAIAIEVQKPLFLHQRDAHVDFIAILDAVRGPLPPVVVHCFTGERQELVDCLDRGFHIGITGWICDERRGEHLRELVRLIPADRLMIETDAPYLLPRTLKPKPSHRRNEPAFLAHLCAEIARERNETPAVTAANSAATAKRFFRLPG
ncbi:MAG: TatD family hydrolase [Xanthomonadales bacterium]|nr:TatD family hydrolase [Xanthomonadales bacterium]